MIDLLKSTGNLFRQVLRIRIGQKSLLRRTFLIKVLNVAGWECRRPLTVFYRDERHLPSAQQAFLRFLKEERPLPPEPD